VLSPEARKQESSARYAFCLRSTVVYQCLYYGADGKVRNRKETGIYHGTTFAFRKDGGVTYLLTNEHAVDWPLVTTTDAKVEGVPDGCKRVSQVITIVESEKDTYTKDDIPLQRVVVDPELDIAVLKARMQVPVIPFSLGQSAAIRAGTGVQVRGFPLGAFQTVNVGKVTNPHDRDQEGRWDHNDFVIDARLSGGNSGSPVLAVSCKSRRFELLGVYHAAYREGQALNVAIGIDDFREIMTTLKPRRHKLPPPTLTAADRQKILAAVAGGATPLFPFGERTIGVRTQGRRLLYDVYSRGFPLADWRLAVIEDLPAPGGFGRIGRVWFGDVPGLKELTFDQLQPPDQHQIAQIVDAFRRQYPLVLEHRRRQAEVKRTREQHEGFKTFELNLDRAAAYRRAVMKGLVEIARRLAPAGNEPHLPLEATTRPSPGKSPPR